MSMILSYLSYDLPLLKCDQIKQLSSVSRFRDFSALISSPVHGVVMAVGGHNAAVPGFTTSSLADTTVSAALLYLRANNNCRRRLLPPPPVF